MTYDGEDLLWSRRLYAPAMIGPTTKLGQGHGITLQKFVGVKHHFTSVRSLLPFSLYKLRGEGVDAAER